MKRKKKKKFGVGGDWGPPSEGCSLRVFVKCKNNRNLTNVGARGLGAVPPTQTAIE